MEHQNNKHGATESAADAFETAPAAKTTHDITRYGWRENSRLGAIELAITSDGEYVKFADALVREANSVREAVLAVEGLVERRIRDLTAQLAAARAALRQTPEATVSGPVLTLAQVWGAIDGNPDHLPDDPEEVLATLAITAQAADECDDKHGQMVADTPAPSTWKSDGSYACQNCGSGLSQHEGQMYCPAAVDAAAEQSMWETCIANRRKHGTKESRVAALLTEYRTAHRDGWFDRAALDASPNVRGTDASADPALPRN